MYPRYWTLFMLKKNFSKFAYCLCFHRVCRTCWICCKCFSQLFMKMRTSSPQKNSWKAARYHPSSSKGHDHPFEKTFFGLEGSLPYIGLLYWDLVVAGLQINLTEVFGPRELIKEVFDSWNRVSISDCDFIQSPIINAESPGSIFLLYQHDWAPARWWAGTDVPLVE